MALYSYGPHCIYRYCVPDSSSEWRLATDRSQRCFSGQMWLAFAVGCGGSLLFAFGYPLVIYAAVRRVRDNGEWEDERSLMKYE